MIVYCAEFCALDHVQVVGAMLFWELINYKMRAETGSNDTTPKTDEIDTI
jgi:hypothetical protein